MNIFLRYLCERIFTYLLVIIFKLSKDENYKISGAAHKGNPAQN